MKKTAILLGVLVLLIFLVILGITSGLGAAFGKRVEMIALIVIAVVLLVMFIVNKVK